MTLPRILSLSSVARRHAACVLALATVSCGLAGARDVRPAMEHVTLHRDDTQYYLGPSLARLPGGEILLGLREAHARPPGERGHVDLTSRGVILRSRDGGRTFGTKQVIDDETQRLSATQDVTLTVLRDGTVLASFYTWRIGLRPLDDGGERPSPRAYSHEFEGLWTIRSDDGGHTWTPRRPVHVDGLPPLAARSALIENDDGSLLLIANDYRRDAEGTRVWARAFCLRSTDRGETWRLQGMVGDGAGDRLHFLEPGWVRLRGGRLLAMLRTRTEGTDRDGYGLLHQSVSDDGGRTWTKPANTGIWGFPAQLLELGDGRLLCVYGYRRSPYGVRARISLDQGATWDPAREIVLRDDGGDPDLGYPVALEVEPGTVLVAYYFNQEKPGDPGSGARYQAGTFLRWPPLP